MATSPKATSPNGDTEEALTLLATRDSLREPAFGQSLAADAKAARDYFTAIDETVQSLARSGDGQRKARELLASTRATKERFLRHHAVALYDEATDGYTL